MDAVIRSGSPLRFKPDAHGLCTEATLDSYFWRQRDRGARSFDLSVLHRQRDAVSVHAAKSWQWVRNICGAGSLVQSFVPLRHRSTAICAPVYVLLIAPSVLGYREQC